MEDCIDHAAIHARIRAWICSYSSDVNPDEQAEAVMKLIFKGGWEDFQWTRGWATRADRSTKSPQRRPQKKSPSQAA